MDIVTYDKAKWHYEHDAYPAELPIRQAFVQIGFVLGWLVDRNLVSDEFVADFSEAIEQFRRRIIHATELMEAADGVLSSDMASDEGNSFLAAYYEATDTYYHDLVETLGASPTTYHIEDTWENYAAISSRMDKRFAHWREFKSL